MQYSKVTMLLCNEIAKVVGSTHTCKQRKNIGKGLKNPVTVFNTRNEKHHDFMTALYQKMTDNIFPTAHSSRSIINEVEKSSVANSNAVVCFKDP